jgi:eukaryotic-like serine/threonine-protein kinase
LSRGPTLAERLERGPLPLRDALAIARQIAEALDAAHEKGIVHRDLKPANIKITPDGTVKVLDFGLARIDASPTAAAPTLTVTATGTRDGTILGTPAYMSPEQARGLPTDKRTDLWAFGCVVYETLTGRAAFAGETVSDTIAAILERAVDYTALPAGSPPSIARLLRRCLEKDPKRRLHSAADAGLEIDDAVSDANSGGVDSTRSSQSQRSARWAWSIAWVAGMMIASVATGITVWMLAPEHEQRPVMFVVHPPEGSQFERRSMAPEPALSRDGRQLAFVAPLDTKPVIWVQAIGDLRARALPGSEEARFPFWSPEADMVGYVAGRQLKKIASSGDRAPQDLCTCDATFGGTWSLDGTVVFSGSTGLYRVSSAGGEPVPLTRVDPSRGEFSHRFPSMLPDGRRFLYLVRSTQDTYRGLYLGSLDEPGLKRRVVPDDSNGSFGLGLNGRPYLFFVRDLALLAQPFDLSRGEVTGDADVVARRVIPGESGRFAPFAVAGRALVYRRTSASQSRLLWTDRHGVPRGSVGKSRAEYVFPSLSPDGTRLAVAEVDARTGRRDIWLIEIEREFSERLTEDPVNAGFPLWTRDGKIIFASARSGPWDVYWLTASGSRSAQPFFRGPTPGLQARYPRHMTRDGRFLLFGDLHNLWAQPLEGGDQAYSLARAFDGRVSPDGRWLAYTSSETVERQVYLTTFPKPTKRSRISTAGGQDPQWRSDGTELYYIAPDQTLMAVAVRPDGTFKNPEILFRASFDRESMAFGSVYSAAPDGQLFLVNQSVQDDDPLLVVTLNWTPGSDRLGSRAAR